MSPQKKNDNFDIVVLNFADSKLPEFKEVRNKDYILCGEKNDYPEYLVYIYNKCGPHRAIINGKTKYILGGGLQRKVPAPGGWAKYVNSDGTESEAAAVNKAGETMDDIMQKSIKDIEIHGGFRWEVIYDKKGEIAEIYHQDFQKFRTDKESKGFWYKKRWINEYGNPTREEPEFIPEYGEPLKPLEKGQATQKQIFAYNEYGPGTDAYPLPEYVGVCNYIDTEIEIGKFHLSSIRNGMMPSKMIQFFSGEPTEDKKKAIEKRFAKRFAGSENAGRFVLIFNPVNASKNVEITDLSFNDLDKQFDLLQKTCDQKIFTGHQVTSPMLFGIKTEGQLGGATELKTAYEVFINTYAKPKQQNLEKIVNYFGAKMGKGNDYYFSQLDPVGIIFDLKDVINHIPVEYILEKIGIPKQYIKPLPAPGATPLQDDSDAAPINPNMKGLSGKDWIHIKRVAREYRKGEISRAAAIAALKSAYGLTEEEIATFLDVEETKMSKEYSEDEVIEMFNSCGDLKEDFAIIRTKKVKYTVDDEAAHDELRFFREAFKENLTNAELAILDLISKDKKITPEVIAETLGATPEYVTAKIAALTKAGLLKSSVTTIGEDSVIERELTKPLKEIKSPEQKVETMEILIKYSYEGPQDSRNRPFCAKLMKLNRLYSRAEIESISLRLGYSVWDRRGGWWTKPDGERSPSCRHSWKQNIVVRKNSGGSK